MKKSIIIVSAIILAAIAFFVYKGFQFYFKIYRPGSNKTIEEKTSFNFLLFGYGGGKHEGAYLTDTIMFAHLDIKNKKVSIFSIPRDLWVKLPTKSGADFHAKINALYQLEIGELGDISKIYPDLDQSKFGVKDDAEFTKFILSQVFGQTIDNYAAIDFEGFKKAMDVIGGVDVDVVKTFDDPQYPIEGKENDLCGKDEDFKKVEKFINNPAADENEKKQLFKDNPKLEEFFTNITETPEKAFPCRYENLHFDKGMTHMNGEIALKYARSRHSIQDGSDFGRSARQQRLIQAVKEKVLSIGFIPKVIPLLEELGKHIRTDVSLDEIKKFIGLAAHAKEYQVTMYVLSDQNFLKDDWSKDGQFILTAKEGVDQWGELQNAIKYINMGILPTPTPSSTPSGNLK